MNAIVPQNLDINHHILDHLPSDYAIPDFSLDHACYILSLIAIIPARNKEIADEIEDNNGYVPICSVALQSVVHNYRPYLNYFIKTGILESDNWYIVKSVETPEGKCKGFRFTKKYQKQPDQFIEYSQKFNSILEKKRIKEIRALKKEYYHLIRWLNPCHVKLDKEEALRYLETKRLSQNKYPELKDVRIDKYGQTKYKNPDDQYEFSNRNVTAIILGDIYIKVDETVQRMHTPFTNVKSEVRNYLTYYDEGLWSNDITTSQPYLALTLFNKTNNLLIKRNKHNRLNIFSNNMFNCFELTLPILEKYQQMTDNEDFKLYSTLVSQTNNKDGLDLYNYMLQECGKYGINYVDRAEVKKEMLKVFFSANGHHTETKDLFKKLFPTVNGLFEDIKSVQKNLLACILQSIESYAVLKVITKRIANQYPNAPLITIHDSIATTERYKDVTRIIMRDELTKLTGFSPKLKEERWHPDEVKWSKYVH